MVLTERIAASGYEVHITASSCRRNPFPLRKVKPVQSPLQSVSKRNIYSIASLFAISRESQDAKNERPGTWGEGGSQLKYYLCKTNVLISLFMLDQIEFLSLL